jgi:hypothetical protein
MGSGDYIFLKKLVNPSALQLKCRGLRVDPERPFIPPLKSRALA